MFRRVSSVEHHFVIDISMIVVEYNWVLCDNHIPLTLFRVSNRRSKFRGTSVCSKPCSAELELCGMKAWPQGLKGNVAPCNGEGGWFEVLAGNECTTGMQLLYQKEYKNFSIVQHLR